MPSQKIATCTYCGTRAALVLDGKTQHELACSACGAPLHDLKMLPTRPAQDDGARRAQRRGHPVQDYGGRLPQWNPSGPIRKSRKKKKSLKKRLIKEAFDILGDILD